MEKRQWYRMTTAEVMRAVSADDDMNTSSAIWRNQQNRPLFLPENSWGMYQYTVVQSGKMHKVAINNLCVGDIVCLKAGDIVPATLRIIKASSLAIKEDVVQGGATIAYKQTFASKSLLPLSQQKNMLFAGTCVVKGSAHAVVVTLAQNNMLLPETKAVRARTYAKKGVIIQTKSAKKLLPKVDSVFFDDLQQKSEVQSIIRKIYLDKGIAVTFFVKPAMFTQLEQQLPSETFHSTNSRIRLLCNYTLEQKAHVMLQARRAGRKLMYVHRGSDISHMPKIADINTVVAQYAQHIAIQQADIVMWKISVKDFASILYNKK